MNAPYWASDDGDVVLHLGDCLAVLPSLPDSSIDAIVTDPPYNLSDSGKRDADCLRRIVAEFTLPDHDERDAEGFQRGRLASPLRSSALLGREAGAVGVDARVGVPVGAVDLKDAPVGQQEVRASDVATAGSPDADLAAVSDALEVERFGGYALKLADGGDAPFCHGTCGCFAEPGAGLIGVLVTLSGPAAGHLLGPLLGGLRRSDEDIRPGDHAGSEAEGATGVLAGRGTEARAVLCLDLARRTGELRLAYGTDQRRPLFLLEPAQPVGAVAGTGGLPAPPEPSGVGLIQIPAGGAFTLHFPWHDINSTRQTRGFMGREWDGWESPASFQRWCLAWATECLRVLKPGGHMLAFGGTRTWHRLTCGIEDAGFEIRDGVASLTGQDAPGLMWIHGQGFPKSLDVSKAIDKRPGKLSAAQFAAHLKERREALGLSRADVAERVTGNRTGAVWNWENGLRYPEARWWEPLRDTLGLDPLWGPILAEAEREMVAERSGLTSTFDVGATTPVGKRLPITAPATEDAARWSGWGTALKPAWEPIVVARKPLKNTVAANVLEFGTGALNIAGCRVDGGPSTGGSVSGATALGQSSGWNTHNNRPTEIDRSMAAGRWPTNIVFTHSAACEPLGAREVRSDGHHPATRGSGGLGTSGHGGQDGLGERKSGTETVEAWACAPDCPVGELDRQSGVLASGKLLPHHADHGKVTGTLGAFAGAPGRESYGDTGGASRFYPTFRYQAKAPASERPRLDDGTAHETVKSLGLMSWLVRLITPPDGTVLDMFAGSGPVGEVCVIEGFRCVLIEQNPKSAELIKTRLAKPIQPAMFGLEAS